MKNNIRANFDPANEDIQGAQVISVQIEENLRKIMIIDSFLYENPDLPQANGLLQQRKASINQIHNFEQTRDMLANDIHSHQAAEYAGDQRRKCTYF